MKRFGSTALFLLFFFFGLILFMPKENLFFAVQHLLRHKDIAINCGLRNKPLQLELLDGTLYFHKMDIAHFRSAKISPWILLNSIVVKNLTIANGDMKIDQMKLRYSPLQPLKIFIEGKSEFGNFNGSLMLKTKKIVLYFNEVQKSKLPPFIKKGKGGYYFETTL